jgi:hypothetical protein
MPRTCMDTGGGQAVPLTYPGEGSAGLRRRREVSTRQSGRSGQGAETLRRDGHVGSRVVSCCTHGMRLGLLVPAYGGSTVPATDRVARAARHVQP